MQPASALPVHRCSTTGVPPYQQKQRSSLTPPPFGPQKTNRPQAAAPAGPLSDTTPPIRIPNLNGRGGGAAASSRDGDAAAPDQQPSASPADPLDPDTLEALLKKATLPAGPTRFSVSDVLRDPNLQRAARRELEGVKQVTGGLAGADGRAASHSSDGDPFAPGAYDGAGHDGEVDRQRATVRELDEQVAAESRVNRGMASVLCERLDSSRK
jgi:hypothetical protein